MTPFHVSATGHSLNYLPHYVAEREGFFAEHGLDVTVSVPRPWDNVLDDLRAGTADAVLGGIWVPAMHFGRAERHTPFAQVSARAPLAILGRERPEVFDWQALPGRVVAMKGSNGASVGLFAKLLMREHGVDPRQVDFIQDLDGLILGRLFAGGMADYLVVDMPLAATIAAEGGGHVVAELPVVGGDVPWSVYYALGESDRARVATHRSFAAALAQGMAWVNARGGESMRPLLVDLFPKLSPALLVRLTDTYRTNGMWPGPQIDPPAYSRWQGGIAAGRLIDAPIPYGELVDARPTAGLDGAARSG